MRASRERVSAEVVAPMLWPLYMVLLFRCFRFFFGVFIRLRFLCCLLLYQYDHDHGIHMLFFLAPREHCARRFD